MVETAVELGSFIDVSQVQTQEYKLPIILCDNKTIELHNDEKISMKNGNQNSWMREKENFNEFLDRNFTNIQKIEILKKIFHGIHTEERFDAIRYIKLLKKKK